MSLITEEIAGVDDIHGLVSRLSKQDRDDINEMVSVIMREKDGDQEEYNAAIEAVIEIVTGPKPKLVYSPFVSSSNDALDRWKDFISQRIKAERESAGMSQTQLAEASGLKQSHISRLEAGKHSPSHITLNKIAKAIGIPLTNLSPNSPG